MANRNDVSPVDEVLNKTDYHVLWADMLKLEEKGTWNQPDWATALYAAMKISPSIGVIQMLVYRNIAMRAVQLEEEQKLDMRGDALDRGL